MLKTFLKNTGISHKVLYSLIYNFEIHYQVTLEIFHAFKLHCFNAIWLQTWQILLFKNIIISTDYLEKLPDAFGVFMTKKKYIKSTSRFLSNLPLFYHEIKTTMWDNKLLKVHNILPVGWILIYYVRDKMRY